jgi:hypothetical protein
LTAIVHIYTYLPTGFCYLGHVGTLGAWCDQGATSELYGFALRFE